MTKTLLLLRHAKSSWKDSTLDDHDRPLNGRGRKSAARIGRLLTEELLIPDLVVCSSATRTRQTADLVFAEIQPVPSIQYRDDLYDAKPPKLEEILTQISEPASCVMLIGHNPGFEEFLSELTRVSQPFPTAALARIDYELESWAMFKASTIGSLVHIWRPRELDIE